MCCECMRGQSNEGIRIGLYDERGISKQGSLEGVL